MIMVDTKRLRQASDILAYLEQGDFNAEVTSQNEELLKYLQEIAPQKGKGIKGVLTIKLSYDVVGNQVETTASVETKAPKRTRGRDFFFLREDGALSTEHPKQANMFDDDKVSPINRGS